MTMTTDLGQRLKQSRKALGLSQATVAEMSGMAQSTYQELESGKSKKSTHLTRIAHVLQQNAYWLETGDLPTSIDRKIEDLLENSTKISVSSDENNHDKIWIDLVNIRFACGNGESIEFHFDEIIGKRAFPISFFKKYGVKPENVKLAIATGDSQEPYICAYDEFAIDLSDTEIRDGEFYAVYFEGEAMLKQILKEEGGKLTLHSLNPKYRDKVVSVQNGLGFRVIGRQFYRAG